MPLSNGSLNDETAAFMDYQLRTKAVVDETLYPRNQNMKSEEARLKTFSSWPSSAPVRPRDLAQAGFFYLGKDDRVQCFCCGGKLSGWEPGDTPWGEHEKHYSHCFYVLGHDVGNVPLPEDAREDEETGSRQRHRKPSSNMENLEERLGTFARVQHPIDHELLAQAGFYSKGKARVFKHRRF